MLALAIPTFIFISLTKLNQKLNFNNLLEELIYL